MTLPGSCSSSHLASEALCEGGSNLTLLRVSSVGARVVELSPPFTFLPFFLEMGWKRFFRCIGGRYFDVPKHKENSMNTAETATMRSGRQTIYHPNSKGTGAALQLDMRLNEGDETRYDCFFINMARQKTIATREEGNRKPASFDWENKVAAKLDFSDICELLSVLEGVKDRPGDGKGLYHSTKGTNTLIDLCESDQRPGYSLSISKKNSEGENVFRAQILLTRAESLGLKHIFQTSLFFLTFHHDLNLRNDAAQSTVD